MWRPEPTKVRLPAQTSELAGDSVKYAGQRKGLSPATGRPSLWALAIGGGGWPAADS